MGVEKEYTLLQSHIVASTLFIHNFEPLLTRMGDNYITLTERAEIANGAGALAFLSYHFNASGSEEPSGTQALYWKTSEEAEALAKALLDRIAPLDGAPDERWERVIPVPQPTFRNGMEPTVLKKTVMPAVIIETEFGTNPADAQLLFDPSYMVAVARASVEALEDWL